MAGDAILSRCIDFVRKNEEAIREVHSVNARSFQVQVERGDRELWGITWVREKFLEQRRVVQSLVPSSPAARWNEAQEAGEWRIESGDELVAVNGLRSWEEMSSFKDLREARLTFVRSPKEDSGEAARAPSKDDAEPKERPLRPPAFEMGGYLLDASGSGWWGHPSGWLFNQAEGVYFHTASGKLFVDEGTGPVQLDGGHSMAVKSLRAPARLKGCIRWFSHKGFGFIEPDDQQGLSGDVYAHRSELQQPEGAEAFPLLPWLPGMPVEFDLSMKDGKPSAVAVRHRLDFHVTSEVGSCLGSNARCNGKAAIAMKADTGHPLTGCFCSLVGGRQGLVDGAELVALHLAQDLSQGFVGREQGGIKGAKAAMLAGFQTTQQRFMQYAQRLSTNSAKIWLAAETSALTCLVFGPEGPDSQPYLLVGDVGSDGKALVLRRDGSVSQRFFGRCQSLDSSADKTKDALKAFEHGLKGPSISFPPIPGARLPKDKKGFGAHAKEAGLMANLELCQLDWSSDAILIMGNKAFWDSFDEQQLRHFDTRRSCQELAQSLSAASSLRCRSAEDSAVLVMRFPWAMKATPAPVQEGRRSKKTKKRKVEEVDDIFAPAQVQEEQEEESSEESFSETIQAPSGVPKVDLIAAPAASQDEEMYNQEKRNAAVQVNSKAFPETASDELDNLFSEFCNELSEMQNVLT